MSGRSTHGHTRGPANSSNRTTPEFRSWCAMKARCLNSKNAKFYRYGARGIKVCTRWLGSDGFANFLVDMGPKPTTKRSIDRFPDRNGNYAPGNCRWATAKEQAENRDPTPLNVNARKTHCPSGHPYSGYNLRITVNGDRKCKECERLRAHKVRRLKREIKHATVR